MNYIKYAFSQYLYWLGIFATIITVVSLFPLNIKDAIKWIILGACFLLPFLIPFSVSFFRRNYRLTTIGKTKLSLMFGNLFNEKCFVITTDIYFDVNPTGKWISPSSLLGEFVNCFFKNKVGELEKLIHKELSKLEEIAHKDKNGTSYYDYGTTIKIKYHDKIIYFLAFSHRLKTKQPDDFYILTLQKFLETILNENHGETIAVPLFGDNNNLSNSGFDNSAMSLKCLMAMINNFEIRNQRSEIKLKIVALPEKRSTLLGVIKHYKR